METVGDDSRAIDRALWHAVDSLRDAQDERALARIEHVLRCADTPEGTLRC